MVLLAGTTPPGATKELAEEERGEWANQALASPLEVQGALESKSTSTATTSTGQAAVVARHGKNTLEPVVLEEVAAATLLALIPAA